MDINYAELKKHAKDTQQTALQMFLDPQTPATAESINQIYKMLEVAEMVMEVAKEDPTKDHAKDELMGAEEYLDMFEESKDPDYLEMANDEANHARKFILQGKEKGVNIDSMLDWHKSIVERIGKYRA